MNREFKTFAEYWNWAKNVSEAERRDCMATMPYRRRKQLEKDYHERHSRYFELAYPVKTYADYVKMVKPLIREDRIKIINAMTLEQKRNIIKGFRDSKMTPRPTFEYRFSNGDVFLTSNADATLDATSEVVINHRLKSVVKNRYGLVGEAAYGEMFPNDAAVKVKLDNSAPPTKFKWVEYDFDGRVYRIDCPINFGIVHGSPQLHLVIDPKEVLHLLPAPGHNRCVIRMEKVRE